MTAATSSFSDFCFATASETVKMSHKLSHKILDVLDRIKADPNTIGMAFTFASSALDLAQRAKNITSYNPAIRIFGSVGAVYNTFQIGGTLHYVALAIFSGKPFFNDKNTIGNFIKEVSFGVANLGGALIWANEHSLIDLGRYSIQSIGGIALGSLSLSGAITVGAIAGFSVLALWSISKLNGGNLTFDEKMSNICTVAWTVSEIALMIIPAVGLAPAAPWIITGTMFAKAAGITSFIYS